MEFVSTLVLSILVALFVREAVAYAHLLRCWLVRRASKQLPQEFRERFIEERLANIEDLPGEIQKLLEAVGSFRNAAEMHRDILNGNLDGFDLSDEEENRNGKKKDEKTLKEEVEKIFSGLRENAIQFKREEVIPALHASKENIIVFLDKKGISNSI